VSILSNNTEKNIISIQGLVCSYDLNANNKVLSIENLAIEKGKIVFLIGASGSGKSTLLETIGLMNNTIASGSVLVYSNSETIDYAELWRSKSDEQLGKLRKEFLSFIFQNTNLMENFTAYENICLSQMIKSGVTQAEAMNGATELMSKVGLPPSIVGLDTLAVNLSGGQRQRISFVRALNTSFKILLCDEPTGNLDEINANELINIVRSNLDNEKTAIIVSHDINLALKHADQIIVITRNQKEGYGEVLPENIYNKDSWAQLNQVELSIFRNNLIGFFAKGSTSPTATQSEQPKSLSIEAKRNYKKLFAQKEGNALYGKSYINLSIITAIIAITLLAVGLANGTIKYLSEKLNDKFVNYLAVEIPFAKNTNDQVKEFISRLTSAEVKKEFFIDTISTFKVVRLDFFENHSESSSFIQGRVLEIEDPLSLVLFDKDNLIWGDQNFRNNKDLGIVVTTKFLKSLGYSPNQRIIFLNNGDAINAAKTTFFKVPIPIRAIVKEIPGKNNFMITEHFLKCYKVNDGCVFNLPQSQKKRMIFYIEKDKSTALEFKKNLEKIFNNYRYTEKKTSDKFSALNDSIQNAAAEEIEEVQELKIFINFDTCHYVSFPAYEVSVDFDNEPYSYATTLKSIHEIENSSFFKTNSNHIGRLIDYNGAMTDDSDIAKDYMCINFAGGGAGLSKIEQFANFMHKSLNNDDIKGQNNIEIDTGAVKEKKNFSYLSKMTLLISGLLITFAVLSIALFISNLLKTHLNKVKINLGTYKAFGLSDAESQHIYLIIMIKFIIVAIGIASLFAIIFGSIIDQMLEALLQVEDQSQYFVLHDLNTYVIISIIVSVTIVVSFFNIKKILSKTPGDLIYNR
jgi:ABC-type lipoprotein export system ATPase subunit